MRPGARTAMVRPGYMFIGLALAFVAGAASMWAVLPVDSIAQATSPAAEPVATEPPTAPLPDKTRSRPQATLTPIAFADIPGWAADDFGKALAAFKVSCRRTADNPDRFAGEPAFGTAAEWSSICRQALNTTARQARAFFESAFQPVRVSEGGNEAGHITGYYEPELEGSRTWSLVYSAPVYPLPHDLIAVDAVAFAGLIEGDRVGGKVVGNRLVRYDTRAEIETHAYAQRVTPLMYMRSPADAFFLQIQGSGRVKLAEGGNVRLGYAGQNGHAYTPIGSILVQRGELTRDQVSMQTIRAWLVANPHEADELMNANASYVFFAERDITDLAQGPEGAEGVPLTPGRSLAVDKRVYPYGMPIFVRGEIGTGKGKEHETMARLMVAQDTGGAIRGVVRGDVFFGWGPEAEARAGATDGQARFYALRPKRPEPGPARP